MVGIFDFETAVVGRRVDGDLTVAIMQSLPPPLEKVRTCVVVLQCTQAAADALCATIARTR